MEQKFSPEQERFCKLCHDIFITSVEGQELLDILKDTFLQSPVAMPDKDSPHAYFREGENNLIRRFIVSADMYKEITKAKDKE